MTPTTLDALLDALRSNSPDVLDRHGDWTTDLPTFGGPAPEVTDGIWSWDADRLLVGTCADDLAIVERETECAYCGRTLYGERTLPSDAAAWAAEAQDHAEGCEWVETRAHTRAEAAAS